MIQIKDISKSYGKFTAVESMDLTINSSSLFGLVGINGAGKSTLLRMLAGVMAADSGNIKVDGLEVFGNKKAKSKILFLPDEPY